LVPNTLYQKAVKWKSREKSDCYTQMMFVIWKFEKAVVSKIDTMEFGEMWGLFLEEV
jgi:hypothetical protein